MRKTILPLFLCTLVTVPFTLGCKRPKSSAASAQTRQARAMADKEEELEFRDENGKTDWRGRVDAAEKAFKEAESNFFWGQKGESLEKALDAARMLPPPGKDFDLPELGSAEPSAESGKGTGAEVAGKETGAPGKAETASSETPGTQPPTSEPSDLASEEPPASAEAKKSDVTNREVAELRRALNELLGRLEGGPGSVNNEVRLDREAIEIE